MEENTKKPKSEKEKRKWQGQEKIRSVCVWKRERTSAHLFILLFFPGVNGREDEAQLSSTHTHKRTHPHTHTHSTGSSVGNNRERRLLIQTNGGRWRWMKEGTGEQRERCVGRERLCYTDRQREGVRTGMAVWSKWISLLIKRSEVKSFCFF